MAASTKSDLQRITEAEYGKLETLIAPIPEAQACAKDADDTSIKDVVAHRAHWIDLFLGWYHDGQAGRVVHFPAQGYKWNQLKAYNADLRRRQADLTWDEARTLLADAHRRLLSLLADLSDDALYGAPMAGGRNHWTAGRWAEASGASHYRSAAKYVRARLRALRN